MSSPDWRVRMRRVQKRAGRGAVEWKETLGTLEVFGSGWFFTSERDVGDTRGCGVKRDVGYTRGAVVCSRSCVVVLVEAKGPRGTRTSRDEQPASQ